MRGQRKALGVSMDRALDDVDTTVRKDEALIAQLEALLVDIRAAHGDSARAAQGEFRAQSEAAEELFARVEDQDADVQGHVGQMLEIRALLGHSAPLPHSPPQDQSQAHFPEVQDQPQQEEPREAPLSLVSPERSLVSKRWSSIPRRNEQKGYAHYDV
ncbi:hypothetical protein B484DRAFT_458845 [Ochromonadaceae sp. CCMP2298]|nr:hypothetical protein B484DRAFT_458845 [Ochromonadaceae sp. CCMP2298]